MLTKNIVRIIERKPESFKGSKREWSKLIRSLIIPPDPNYTWVKNEKTFEWERVRVS